MFKRVIFYIRVQSVVKLYFLLSTIRVESRAESVQQPNRPNEDLIHTEPTFWITNTSSDPPGWSSTNQWRVTTEVKCS